MPSFSEFLQSIYRDGNDGKQFERFVKWFLKHDPEWATQVEKVWLWDDWPGRWGPDKGIDLVFRHRDGEIWAVQAKCYSSDYYITKADIDTFLSESNRKGISRRLLMASTDKIGDNAKEVCAGQEKPVTQFLFSDFEKAAIEYPSDYKQLIKGKRKPKPSPHDYQDAAITDVVKGFKSADRGQLIMACGTGKTFTTLWIKEKLKSKITLVLLPSLNLLSQTVREWTFASKSKIDVLCVCSDKTVGRKRDEDEVIQSVSDVPFPVHSEVSEIRKFMKGAGDKVVFSTYQSSDLVAEAQKDWGLPPFDLVVADEAHRCAISGKPDSPFATVLDVKRIRANKRLFATATPRTYAPAVKKAAEGRGVEVVGMDDESVFGKQFHTLTFGKAIRHDPPLLTDYQVVIIGVDNARIAEWIETRELVTTEKGEIETDAETLAAQIGLLKAIKDFNLKRVISFHSRVKRAQDFAEDIGAAAEVVDKRHLPKDKIRADFVSGHMSAFDRGDKLKRLKQTGPKEISLLANARCLSEGIDVPSLDGVAFIDPKNSQVDIIQAVGRAIRLSGDKTVGTIVLPVFIQDGDDAEECIEASNFKPISWVLNALKAHDDVLADELDAIRTDMGRTGSATVPIGSIPKIVLDLPVTVDASFADALKTHLVEQSTPSWNFWFGLLKAYVSENGDALVPTGYLTADGHRLFNWVSNQRSREDVLTRTQIDQLNAQPRWIWDVLDFKWEDGYTHLKQYVEDNGDTIVKGRYLSPDGYRLGSWLSTQRINRAALTQGRKERLEALTGWVWEPQPSQWEEGYRHLKQYVADNGDALVPTDCKAANGFNLGGWVSTQRGNNESISGERKSRLSALPGWVWNISDYKWAEGFKYLKEYRIEFGDAFVSSNFTPSDGFKLGQWVLIQRRRKDNLTEDQIKCLEALDGWVWDVIAHQWEEGFRHLNQYIVDNGHAFVPAEHKASDGYTLGRWVNKQRTRINKLSEDQKERLEALGGWVWDILSFRWEEGFEYLKLYVKDSGDALVPTAYKTINGYKLGAWVGRQRQANRKGTLSKDRKERLEALIGWAWNKHHH